MAELSVTPGGMKLVNRTGAPSDTACMSLFPTTAMSDALPPLQRPWYARLANWVAESRAHRVICLVAGIWLLNAFDLILTLLAHSQGVLDEENPVARTLLGMGTPSLVLFKIGLVLIGTYPLLRYRRARITELGTLVILVAYALLAVHWRECYELYSLTVPSSIHMAEIENALGAGS